MAEPASEEVKITGAGGDVNVVELIIPGRSAPPTIDAASLCALSISLASVGKTSQHHIRN